MKLRHYMEHIREHHAVLPTFSITCGMNGCHRKFRKFISFRTHVYQWHGGDPNVSNNPAVYMVPFNRSPMDEELNVSCNMDDSPTNEDSSLCNDDHIAIVPQHELSNIGARFLIETKEHHKLTQSAIDGIIQGVTCLMQVHLKHLHTQVNDELSGTTLCPDLIQRLDQLFSDDSVYANPFSEVLTKHKQLEYLRKHFQLIDPERIVLGEQPEWKGCGRLRRCKMKKHELVYISILKTLELLLQSDTFRSEIDKAAATSKEWLEDYKDGSHYRNHPLLSKHSSALQIFLYYDDLEVCNPLGSKAKIHKLSMFYFTLGKVSPTQRSKLSSIYLVAILKEKYLKKYGMNRILKPIVQDLQKLETGHKFTIKGEEQLYFGVLCAVSADNLASLALGGFKESCIAYRMCRQCMATQDAAKTKFKEEDFILRDPNTHKHHCAQLELSSDASKEYGINRNSYLNELRYFNVCDGGLVPDIMHDILEGALQYEVKLMLKIMIEVKQYFNLDLFNARLTNTELGYMEVKDKCSMLDATTLHSNGHTLRQSAAQMWLLGRILPLVIGDMVPEGDPYWENYLIMMRIVDIVFSNRTTEDLIGYLSQKIFVHHTQFKNLYPNESVIPKMHFMVHMPRLTQKFGPLVYHWTMRYEAKHSYFKTLTHALGNYTNLPYSLAMRYQQYMCYTRTVKPESHDNHFTSGPASSAPSSDTSDLIPSATDIFETKWVTVEGTTYKRNAAIIVSKEEDFKVLVISKIFIADGSKIYFYGKFYKLDTYYRHYRSHTLTDLNKHIYVCYDHLYHHIVMHPRTARVLPHDIIVLLSYYIP